MELATMRLNTLSFNTSVEFKTNNGDKNNTVNFESFMDSIGKSNNVQDSKKSIKTNLQDNDKNITSSSDMKSKNVNDTTCKKDSKVEEELERINGLKSKEKKKVNDDYISILDFLLQTLASDNVNLDEIISVNEDGTVSLNEDATSTLMNLINSQVENPLESDFGKLLLNLQGDLEDLGVDTSLFNAVDVVDTALNFTVNEINENIDDMNSLELLSDVENADYFDENQIDTNLAEGTAVENKDDVDSSNVNDDELLKVKQMIKELLEKSMNEKSLVSDVTTEEVNEIDTNGFEDNVSNVDLNDDMENINDEALNNVSNEVADKAIENKEMNNSDNESENKDGKRENKDVKRININSKKVEHFNQMDVRLDANVKFNEEYGIKSSIKANTEINQKFTDTVNVVKQTIEGISVKLSETSSEMNIKLDSENLGKINLKVVTERGMVIAKFEAESEKVKEILETNMNSLKQTLQEKGISVSGLEVAVNQNMTGEQRERNFEYERKSDMKKNPHKIPRTSINKIVQVVENNNRTQLSMRNYGIGNRINYIA